MTNPTVPVPPVAPMTPAPPAPPGAPGAAPGYAPMGPGGTPPYAAPGAPGYGAPPVGPPGVAPGYAAPVGAEAPKKKSKAGLVIALLVVVLLLVGGAVAFLIAGSGTGPTATIRECRIDADGSLTAAGKVDGADESAKVHVEFRNSDGNDVVDSGSTDASSSGTWEVTGSASDDVQKVTCVVTRVGS